MNEGREDGSPRKDRADALYSGDGRSVTTYFAGKTALYEQFRPSYPTEAIQCILESLGRRPEIADVGCGTGISSRLLASAGARVVGVEPNDEMRHAAIETSRGVPDLRFVAGVAEDTGLPDASFDAVVCAQSFHWFDEVRALAEFRRILRPGGRLALMWNVRETDNPIGAEYESIIDQAQQEAQRRGRIIRRNRNGDPTAGGCFGEVRRVRFPNPVAHDRAGLIGRVRSASYWPESGLLRDELEAMVERFFDRFGRDGVVVLPQVCDVTLASALK